MFKLRTINFVGLVAAYGLGQGSVFLAQTWLLGTGEQRLLDTFSVCITGVVLAFYIVDWSSPVTLVSGMLNSRYAAYSNVLFWSCSVVRLAVCAMLTLAAILSTYFLADAQYIRFYAFGAGVGIIATAFNGIGVLDGLRLSRWSGLFSAFPFVASAATIPFVVHLSHEVAAFWLGLAFSAGSVLSVAGQHLVISRAGTKLVPISVRRKWILRSFKEGGAFLLGWLPGQIFYRSQVLFCASLVVGTSVGEFLYAKQIIVGVSQLLFFLRRVEFPDLIDSSRKVRVRVRDVLLYQKASTASAVAATLLSAILALLALAVAPPQFKQATWLVLAMIPTLLTNHVSSAMAQGGLAQRRYNSTASANIISIGIIGIALSWFAAKEWGVYGLIFVEPLTHILNALLMIYIIYSSNRSRSPH
jgi:hypothetical protein